MKRETYFGVFSAGGKLVFQIGLSQLLTQEQAEIIAVLLTPVIEPTLPDGHYFAFDYKGRV